MSWWTQTIQFRIILPSVYSNLSSAFSVLPQRLSDIFSHRSLREALPGSLILMLSHLLSPRCFQSVYGLLCGIRPLFLPSCCCLPPTRLSIPECFVCKFHSIRCGNVQLFLPHLFPDKNPKTSLLYRILLLYCVRWSDLQIRHNRPLLR